MDEKEAAKAVEYLVEKGHRRIAALAAGNYDSSVSQLRVSGYLNALKCFGIEYSEIISADGYSMQDGYSAMKCRLESSFDNTALFAISDELAIGAMRALHEKKIIIPDECSIISIDGIAFSQFVQPKLTTLCQPVQRMGIESVDILLELIAGGTQRHLTLETTICCGESVAVCVG